jgi:Rieske Fe-S protein
MKKVEKQNKYILMSGDEEITRSTNIQGICDHIGCSFPWIYANKNKDINKDGSWSFNFKGFNYTITNI